jgi:hypothetical protein
MPKVRVSKNKLVADPADVSSLDGIIKALYESVSFAPGKQPNYDRLRTIFHRDGRLIPSKADRDAEFSSLDLESFVTQSREVIVISGLERKGFLETEIARRTQMFGNIIHVFSTYETKDAEAGSTSVQRGINSIQIVREHGRFWIMTVLWDVERPGNAIPHAYLM